MKTKRLTIGKYLLLVLALILLMASIVSSSEKSIYNLEERLLTQVEEERFDNYANMKLKPELNYQNLKFIKFKQYDLVIIYTNMDNKEMKIITTNKKFNEMMK